MEEEIIKLKNENARLRELIAKYQKELMAYKISKVTDMLVDGFCYNPVEEAEKIIKENENE